MYNTDIIKNILAYNKAGFENAFNSILAIQNQVERYIDTTLKQNSYVPEEGITLVKNWFSLIKDTRENVKQALSENQEKMKSFFPGFH